MAVELEEKKEVTVAMRDGEFSSGMVAPAAEVSSERLEGVI